MKNKQFSFDTHGVQNWQNYLYTQDTMTIEGEKLFIETNFLVWLIERFQLTTLQLRYAIDLGSRAQNYFAAQIAEAINLNIPILLEREAAKEGSGNSKTGSVTQLFLPSGDNLDNHDRLLIIKLSYS